MLAELLESLSQISGVKKEFVIAPFFILVSALIGGGIALWAVLANRATARLKNSMDFINQYGKDEKVLEHEKRISGELGGLSSQRISEFAEDENQEKKEVVSIRYVLNHYESMAICIHRDIYDNEIIKDAVFTSVTNVWKICEPYVNERRNLTDTTTYYQETEWLIKKWKHAPLKTKCKKWWHICKYYKTKPNT